MNRTLVYLLEYGKWRDRSIGHAHFLVYAILVVSMSGLVWQTNGENGGKLNINIEYFKIYEK